MEQDIIKSKQDMTWLMWSRIRQSSGTAGSFLKAYSELDGRKRYFKLSNFDVTAGVTGHECVNELICDRLLSILGVDHLHYQLIYADIRIDDSVYETYLCASDDYKRPGESKIALDAYYELERRRGETPMQFCERKGWGDYICRMLAVDYLILNRDRHGANIEILRSSRENTVRPAPLFDHGLSLLFSCHSDSEANRFDVMLDRPVNTFFGSKSTWQNQRLIPPDRMPEFHPLKESDREVLMEGLDGVISETLQGKIWEMIWKRWCAYEDFCHSR